MPVSEIAILPSKSTTVDPPFAALLKQATSIQDKWHDSHYPHLPASARDRAVAWFQQLEDPTRLLTTAKWESVASHHEWIASDENIDIMASLKKYLATSPSPAAVSNDDNNVGKSNVILFHVDGDLFGSGSASSPTQPAAGSVDPLDSPVLSLSRIFVDRARRSAFDAKFKEVRQVLEEYVAPHAVRAGWVVDNPEGAAQDQFVLVSGWESVEQHHRFADTEAFTQFNLIGQFVARAEIKHYKRIL